MRPNPRQILSFTQACRFPLRHVLRAAVAVVGFSALAGATAGSAQVPQCPPGFTWDPRSGAGCVQTNCPEVGYYSYTGECVCLEGTLPCTELVDYDTFDGGLCYPFCPYSVLQACVPVGALCPSDPSPGMAIGEALGDLPVSPSQLWDRATGLLSGVETRPPTPAGAAAAAAVGSALVATWALTDWLSDRGWLDRLQDAGAGLLRSVREAIRPSALAEGVERAIARQAGENLAEHSAEIIDALSLPETTVVTPGTTPPSREGGAGSATAAPPAEASVPPAPISPSAAPSPAVSGPFGNPESKIFAEKDAVAILKALGMIPPGSPEEGLIPMPDGGLDRLVGPHPDGRPREITLPSGRVVIISKVEAIGFTGGDGGTPGHTPERVNLGDGLVITAEMVEKVAGPSAAAGAPVPGGAGASAGSLPSAGGTGAGQAPAGSGAEGQPQDPVEAGSAPRGGRQEGEPGSPEGPADAGGTPTVRPVSVDELAEEFLRGDGGEGTGGGDAPAGDGGDTAGAGEPAAGDGTADIAAGGGGGPDETGDPEQRVPRGLEDPGTGEPGDLTPEEAEEVEELLDKFQELREESERLLRRLDELARSGSGETPPPSDAGVIDGGDVGSATDDF